MPVTNLFTTLLGVFVWGGGVVNTTEVPSLAMPITEKSNSSFHAALTKTKLSESSVSLHRYPDTPVHGRIPYRIRIRYGYAIDTYR